MLERHVNKIMSIYFHQLFPKSKTRQKTRVGCLRIFSIICPSVTTFPVYQLQLHTDEIMTEIELNATLGK